MNFQSFKKAYQNLWMKKLVKPPYKHVVQIGDPILRVKTKAVNPTDIESDNFKQFLETLKNVWSRYDCAGLSAPQIGVDLRVFAMHFPAVNKFRGTEQEYINKEMQHVPYTVSTRSG
uniref:Peptide deformylase n=1 Tax=Clastoptera arizonana TaxID=38151 RepID=A0A1B6DJ01_9HEMI